MGVITSCTLSTDAEQCDASALMTLPMRANIKNPEFNGVCGTYVETELEIMCDVLQNLNKTLAQFDI